MIELYYWPTPNGHKITMYLEEADIPYEIKPVAIGKGANLQAASAEILDQHVPDFGLVINGCKCDRAVHWPYCAPAGRASPSILGMDSTRTGAEPPRVEIVAHGVRRRISSPVALKQMKQFSGRQTFGGNGGPLEMGPSTNAGGADPGAGRNLKGSKS